jgi:hypothetical protein
LRCQTLDIYSYSYSPSLESQVLNVSVPKCIHILHLPLPSPC